LASLNQEDIKANQLTRTNFFSSLKIQTRWADNDIFGHINNVIYYSYVDTAVNNYLIHAGGFDPQSAAIIAVVAESRCQYFHSISYPDTIETHIRVKKLSQRSVIYEVGIFKENCETICAFCHFVHVFVERDSNKVVQIPEKIRRALEKLI